MLRTLQRYSSREKTWSQIECVRYVDVDFEIINPFLCSAYFMLVSFLHLHLLSSCDRYIFTAINSAIHLQCNRSMCMHSEYLYGFIREFVCIHFSHWNESFFFQRKATHISYFYLLSVWTMHSKRKYFAISWHEMTIWTRRYESA